jgi:protein SCO1/2
MIRPCWLLFLALLPAATFAHAATPPAQAPLPSTSVYHLDVPLLDQDARARRFADGRGRARVVSMFYSSCKYVCPLIIDTVKKTRHALGAEDGARLDVLLVSLDPERDTPAVLAGLADSRHLDRGQWTLARTDAGHVRQLAAVLGIQYRQLEDGEFSHSSVLVLLDPEGRIVARTERLGEADPEFVAAVRSTLAAAPSAGPSP